ncbi:TIGR04282 family arsenosugar biosynthesis glycosyltransferase [Hymenobacter terricola]|uniref:TIGR04282 family arsenosugar biosynthesis glycosyltransferase n=1 Tax=Hymenobacter terricola TaxID=2819236 RepID=UPI001B30748F|nr:DUF2064 domain-containing protein [Hymenobacter terricola]
MTKPTSAVAILLFTRSAGQDAAHKKLVSNGARADNVAVVAQLISHATATARQVGADFLCIDSCRQTGATFGARLSRAMHEAFASGYEQLLVIGNDCPQLDVGLLRRALAMLAMTGAVLGPATDGGVYLLGVARTYFDSAVWAALPWQTALLGRALAHRLRAAGAAVQQLPALADVDNEQDLAQVLRQPMARHQLRALRRLRRHLVPRPWPGVQSAAPLALTAAYPHRGPPNC